MDKKELIHIFVTVSFTHKLHSIILARIQLEGQHKPSNFRDVTPFILPILYRHFG